MRAARRTVVTRSTRLAAKASPYHSAVTIYGVPGQDGLEPDIQLQAGPSAPRRTRRVKREAGTSGVELPGEAEHFAKDNSTSSRRQRVKIEVSDPERERAGSRKASLKKQTSKGKVIPQSLDVPHPAPLKWEEVYTAIKEMRSRVVAPVDTMGCDQAQFGEQEPRNQRFATLVSLMLSSQTKDEVTDAAVSKLRNTLGGSLSVEAVLKAGETTISDAIAKVGFWRRKTQYIKQTAQRLHDDFESDVPKTVDELCSLPGVGPKMAFLALQVAWKLNAGIGVDVHVHRITNRLGWHNKPTKNPEETRLNLQSWLPKELHGEINHLLVGFGQTICLPVSPKCGDCALSTGSLCPSARSAGTKASRAASRKGSSKSDCAVAPGPNIEIEIEVPRNQDAKEE